jgi:hypothetical protein
MKFNKWFRLSFIIGLVWVIGFGIASSLFQDYISQWTYDQPQNHGSLVAPLLLIGIFFMLPFLIQCLIFAGTKLTLPNYTRIVSDVNRIASDVVAPLLVSAPNLPRAIFYVGLLFCLLGGLFVSGQINNLLSPGFEVLIVWEICGLMFLGVPISIFAITKGSRFYNRDSFQNTLTRALLAIGWFSSLFLTISFGTTFQSGFRLWTISLLLVGLGYWLGGKIQPIKIQQGTASLRPHLPSSKIV